MQTYLDKCNINLSLVFVCPVDCLNNPNKRDFLELQQSLSPIFKGYFYHTLMLQTYRIKGNLCISIGKLRHSLNILYDF